MGKSIYRLNIKTIIILEFTNYMNNMFSKWSYVANIAMKSIAILGIAFNICCPS